MKTNETINETFTNNVNDSQKVNVQLPWSVYEDFKQDDLKENKQNIQPDTTFWL